MRARRMVGSLLLVGVLAMLATATAYAVTWCQRYQLVGHDQAAAALLVGLLAALLVGQLVIVPAVARNVSRGGGRTSWI